MNLCPCGVSPPHARRALKDCQYEAQQPTIDERPTTVQIRAWTLQDVKDTRELLSMGGLDALPEGVREFAKEQIQRHKGDPWPNWLIMGLGMRALRDAMGGAK